MTATLARASLALASFASPLAALASAFAALAPGAALAEEPKLAGEPVIMREPGEPLVIADAADGADPFDIELGLSYRFEAEFGTLTQGDVDGASHQHLTSTLVPEARVGMFADLATVIRLPVLLAETRRIERASGGPEALGASDDVLARLPFEAPARSGLLAASIGLTYGLMNQSRSAGLPTWNVGLFVDVSAGDEMHACDPSPGEDAVSCADPFDADRDGERDEGEPALDGELDAGVTRESVTLRAETKLSRRIRHVEPFLVLDAAFELPLEHSPLLRGGAFTLPPVRASLELGAGLIPWENRERHSRVWLDVRVRGSFFTSGPDFTPLFDALGASPNASLRAVTSDGATDLAFEGVTERGARGTFGAASSFVWRASQLIRLGLDLDLEYQTAHALAAPCEESACDVFDRDALHAGGELGLADDLTIGIGASGAVMF